MLIGTREFFNNSNVEILVRTIYLKNLIFLLLNIISKYFNLFLR
ncbi:hypothetical protein LEP1GSC033_0391 [Leptospira interrogans str. 2002000632]|nr:hypothetical protein LEP1GSC033_0391 [Leptospira interrogans str. 2002000632]